MKNSITIDFKHYIDTYINTLDRKEITKNSYKKILLQFEKYLWTNSINLPVKKDILGYKEYLSKSVRSATIQKTIVVLRGFFTYLDSEGVYKNILNGVRGVKIEPTFKRSAFSVNEVQMLIRKAKVHSINIEGKRNYSIVLLLATTGLRTIEVERANVIDLVDIRGDYRLFIQGKGHDDKDEYVKLSSDVYNTLMDYIMSRNSDSEALFINHDRNYNGKRITTRTVRRVVKELIRQIGIDDSRYTTHSLRHSLATNLMLHGQGTLEETKQILRHKDISTTQLYNHSLKRSQNNGELIMSEILLKDMGDNNGNKD